MLLINDFQSLNFHVVGWVIGGTKDLNLKKPIYYKDSCGRLIQPKFNLKINDGLVITWCWFYVTIFYNS